MNNKYLSLVLVWSFLIIAVPFIVLASESAESTENKGNREGEASSDQARQWMQRADTQARHASDGVFSRSVLMTCRFGKRVNKKSQGGKARIACAEAPRVKVLESVEKQFGSQRRDSKSISIVLEPASERGIGMLTYQYDELGRDTESWLYLSALGKVKRLVTGSDEAQEPVSFFGSEFTTEDMETGKVDEYLYRMVEEGDYQGRPTVVIEAVPNEVKRRKSRYSRSLIWIDKARTVVVKTQSYDRRDALLKRLQLSQFERINGVWTARSAMMINVQTQRLSRFQMKQLVMGIQVPDEFLTQRTLSDFAFREQILEGLRGQVQ